MQQKYAEMYRSGQLGFSADPYQKERDEYRQRAEYYYGMYCAGHCVFGYGGSKQYGEQIEFRALRNHARGMQPPEKYMDILDPLCTDKQSGRQYRKWNISWRTDKRLSKHRDRMITKFMDVVTEPVVMATDAAAAAAKDLLVGKMKMVADPRTQEFSRQTGYPVNNPVKGLTPEDIDIYRELGGIALPPEVDMKDAIDDMLDRSKWPLVKKMLVEDLIDLGAYCFHVFRRDSRLFVEYVDPEGYFRRFSEYPDGRDSDFKAFVKTRRVAELRQWLGDGDLKKIKMAYGYRGRQRSGARQDYDRSGDREWGRYGEESVEVMTLYFVDTQVQVNASGRHKRGARVFDPISPDTEFEPRHQREKVSTPIHYLYKCNWVVGTDVVYDYGVADTIVREGQPGSKEVVIPLFDYVSQEPSIIERCIGFDDDIQIATFKLRNVIKKMIPGPGMAINKTAIKSSVAFGKEKQSIKESMEGLFSDGMFFYETLGAYDLPGADEKYGYRNFIDFLPPADVNKLTILHNEILRGEENIRSVTGSNPLEDGQASGDLLKHTAQSMTAGTNSAIAPHVQNYIYGFQRMCHIACQAYRLMVLDGDIVVGNQKKTKLTRDLFHRDWNVKVLVDRTQTKEMLLQDLMMMRDQIPSEAYYEIYNAISQHDLKKAQILLSKNSAKAQELAHQRQIEVQTAQAEGNARAGVAVENAKAEAAMAAQAAKEAELMLQAKLDEEKAKEDHKRKLEIIREQSKLSYEKDMAVAQTYSPLK